MVTVPCSGAVPNAQVPPTSAPILSLVATLPVAVVLMAVLKLSSPAVGASFKIVAPNVAGALVMLAPSVTVMLKLSSTLAPLAICGAVML